MKLDAKNDYLSLNLLLDIRNNSKNQLAAIGIQYTVVIYREVLKTFNVSIGVTLPILTP